MARDPVEQNLALASAHQQPLQTLDQLPLVNSRSFFIQSPSGAAYRTELLQKICRTQHVFPQFIAFCSCFCLPNKSEISLHFSRGQWRVRAPYDITKVSVLELCFNTNFLKSGTCKKKKKKLRIPATGERHRLILVVHHTWGQQWQKQGAEDSLRNVLTSRDVKSLSLNWHLGLHVPFYRSQLYYFTAQFVSHFMYIFLHSFLCLQEMLAAVSNTVFDILINSLFKFSLHCVKRMCTYC